ncbi:MAG TPA: 4-alpha-glucanotransferase [Vicinamibacteria bacterium]
MSRRTAGILLHPTSLPGPYGIGDLGPECFRFLDFLAAAGQGLWQVLPLGPTGYGDSPYQCFSAFAGNPLLISLDALAEDGLLSKADLAKRPAFPAKTVDFGAVIAWKRPLLDKAFAAFEKKKSGAQAEAFETFITREAGWLDDFALFMAMKESHDGRAWPAWEDELVQRDAAALARAREAHGSRVRAVAFFQYLFFEHWAKVRKAAHERGIRILGDIPIFVSHDSADVWSHPELFHLSADGSAAKVAGVPPDYFSATGQLWGNPLYRWDVLARDGYAWWIDRFRGTLRLVDLVRLDHFRGFEAYWEIPGGEPTAVNGHWVKGPGAEFFLALERGLGQLPVVAEDLGVITPEVAALRDRFGLPGMAILQFAWGSDDQANDFLPYNYPRNKVVYTGGHDNDTTVGWWTAGVGDSTRSEAEVARERDFCLRYLGSDGREIHWDFIRAVLASVADTAVVPVQDLLGLGNEARMNLPGRLGGNWLFRYEAGALDEAVTQRLRGMTQTYGRAPVTPRPDGKG